jgi:predicted DNA-binding transcriptional regulator AlpA
MAGVETIVGRRTQAMSSNKGNENNGVGICVEIGALPSGAIVTEKGLAGMLGKSQDSIKRAVERGELPPPVRLMGKPTWTAGSVVRHIEKRLEEAAREAQADRARILQHSP